MELYLKSQGQTVEGLQRIAEFICKTCQDVWYEIGLVDECYHFHHVNLKIDTYADAVYSLKFRDVLNF